MRLHPERGLGLSLRLVLALAVLVFFLFPIYWLAIIAFKTPEEIFAYPPVWVPENIQFANYLVLFKDGDAETVFNSLFIAGVSTVFANQLARMKMSNVSSTAWFRR